MKIKLTPQEIVEQEFSSKFKGFDREEVKNFLIQVAEVLENQIQEKESYKKEIDRLKETLVKLEKREEILRDTLVSAQKFSNEIKSSAQKEAELIIKEGEVKSEEIIGGAISRRKDLKEEIRNLKFKRREIENDLVNMLNSLKELIESYRRDDEEFDKVEYIGK
jgi:cell division initiation protein